MSDQASAKIQLRDVAKRFGDHGVLKGVDLGIGSGRSVVLIGPSGSGKTTVMKCVLGLTRPDSGSILVDGGETARLSGQRRTDLICRFGMLFQKGGLFDSMTVWENVAFRLLQERRMDVGAARELAVTKLADVGLDADVADLYPPDLSGGMQKRVGIARAVAADPEILLLDEPTAGLDPIMTNVITKLILQIVRDLGATAFSITSDMTGARALADSIAMLYDGRVIWHGATAEVDSSGNEHVDQFIHSRAKGPIEMRLHDW